MNPRWSRSTAPIPARATIHLLILNHGLDARFRGRQMWYGKTKRGWRPFLRGCPGRIYLTMASAIAEPRSEVVALPPMSGVRGAPEAGSSTASIARMMAAAASG